MKTTFSRPRFSKKQTGALLVEAMVAIIIFTIGVLALIGVQAAVMRSTTDSKIRLDAEFLADQLVSEMGADARINTAGGTRIDAARLTARYGSVANGPGYQRWLAKVTAAGVGGLPGAAANPPVVVITPVAIAGTPPVALVDISLFWRLPKDDASQPARRVVTRSILN